MFFQVAMYTELEYKKHMFASQAAGGKESKVKETPSNILDSQTLMYKSEHPRSYWLSSFFFPQGIFYFIIHVIFYIIHNCIKIFEKI